MAMDWPDIGTTYPTRAAAKIALCRIAVARQESFSTTSSGPNFVCLSCTAIGVSKCTFSINLRLVPTAAASSATSTSAWMLDGSSRLDHAHTFTDFSTAERDRIRVRLLNLLKRWQIEEKQDAESSATTGTGSGVGSSADGQEQQSLAEDETVEEEEGAVETLPTVTTTMTATAGTSQGSDLESGAHEESLFPSYGSEAALIDALVDDKDMILTLPTTREDIAFDSSYEAAIQLHVASRQAHFTLYISRAGPSAFNMYCGRGHSQCPTPLCTYRLNIASHRQANGGRWLASLAGDGEHNHPIGQDAPPPRRFAGAAKESKMGKYRPLKEVANPVVPAATPKIKKETNASPPKKTTVVSEWSKAPSGNPMGLSFEKSNSNRMQALIAETIKEYYEFPTPGSAISYASHEDYRLHVVCAALQRDFSCAIRYSCPNLIRFYCARGGARGTPGACSWTMEASRDSGEWQTSKIEGTHSHKIRSDESAKAEVERAEKAEAEILLKGTGSSSVLPKGREWDGEREENDRPKKKQRTSAYPSPSPSLATVRANDQLTASSSSASHPLPAPIKYTNEQHDYKPVIPPPRAPRRIPDPSFLPNLASFLHSLSSSLVPIAPNLLALGFDSQSALAALFTLSDNALESLLGPHDKIYRTLMGTKLAAGAGGMEEEGWGEDYERMERKIPLAQSRLFILALKRAKGEIPAMA